MEIGQTSATSGKRVHTYDHGHEEHPQLSVEAQQALFRQKLSKSCQFVVIGRL